MSPEPEIDTLFPFGRNLASTTLLDRGATWGAALPATASAVESAMVSAPVGFHCLQRALRQVTTCRGARGRIVRCLSTDRQRRTPSKKCCRRAATERTNARTGRAATRFRNCLSGLH